MLEHAFGSRFEIELVNGHDAPITLRGEGCGHPLRLRALDESEVNWRPDCGTPFCAPAGDNPDCGVCDCGPITIGLQPTESTTVAWEGHSYVTVEVDAECNACNTCWLAEPVEPGTYEAVVRYEAPCTGDPIDCDLGPPDIRELTHRFEYPGTGTTVVLQ